MTGRAVWICAVAACLMVLAGCSASIGTRVKSVPEPPLSRSIAPPGGWIDATDKALSPDVEYWLMADDRSASMILKELRSSVPGVSPASNESVVTLAHISLRLKLAVLGNGMRVTQVPAMFDANPAYAVYAYSEKNLLRRVLVFRKRSRLYELELAQETEVEGISRHMSAQISFAMSVLKK